MGFWKRMAIMVAASYLMLMMIGAGLDPAGMVFVGMLAVVFATLPLIILIAFLHGIQKLLGPLGTILVLMIGLLPTIFVFFIAPAMGIKGGEPGYIAVLCLSGLPWSLAWLMTSPERFSTR